MGTGLRLELLRSVGLGLLETTTGLELRAAGPELESLPTVTGLKFFPSGLETLLVETLVTDISAELLTSGGQEGSWVLEISEVTLPPSSFCWIWEYLKDATTTVEPAEVVGAEQPSSSIWSSSGTGVQEGGV